MHKRIALIGLPGSGKSSVSLALAKRTGLRSIDLDREIERFTAMSIARLFSDYGEAFFREMERDCLEGCRALDRIILASGGGAVELAENRKAFSECFFTIWIDIDAALAFERIQDEMRPVLGGSLERMLELERRRRSLYESSAHLIVKAGRKSIEEISGEIYGHIA